MTGRTLAVLVFWTLLLLGAEGRCGDRLERALGMMQQRANAAGRRRYEVGDPGAVYHRRLRSAPIDVSVSKLAVEVCPPRSASVPGCWPRLSALIQAVFEFGSPDPAVGQPGRAGLELGQGRALRLRAEH
jgi:hypothetical protein